MIQPTLDKEKLSKWVGKTETRHDVLDTRQATLMATILSAGHDLSAGAPLPPLWNWIYFPTQTPMTGLGQDGHSALGGFLPPIDLPRRMWAGGRFTFHHPLGLGAAVTRHSEIKSITLKSGRSGTLCFITVQHSFLSEDKICLTEEHDIVYRQPAPKDAPATPYISPPQDPEITQTIKTSPVMLFRYSALTFNGHRIHYDIDYCRDVEGYPGLVFHGPLTATLLADLALQQGQSRRLKTFEFRAVQPIFSGQDISINAHRDGNQLCLWAETADKGLCMTATATFA